MSGKTNKSFTKRLKITKTGKILSRRSGINHFKAKKSRSKQLGKKRHGTLMMSNKERARFLN